MVTMPAPRATRSTGPAVRKREYIPRDRPPMTVAAANATATGARNRKRLGGAPSNQPKR